MEPADKQLIDAARKGDASGVEAALADGADVNAVDRLRRTALHWACAERHELLVPILLRTRADVNATDVNGFTSLHRACVNGHVAIVFQLLRAGARVDVTDELRRTPRAIAEIYRYKKCVDQIDCHIGMLSV